MKLSTIKDVARQAGVSTATVSHVINGTRYVSSETQSKVLMAIQELGYRPNNIARSLRGGKTGTVGLIFCDLKSPFFSELFQGIETRLGEKGFDVLVINTGYDIKKEKKALDIFFSKKVDGIILVPVNDQGEHVKFLIQQGIPLVLLDKAIPGIETDLVLVNNFEGSKQMVEYLIGLGHTEIGIISGPLNTTTGKERYKGYVAALKEHQLPIDASFIQISDFTENGGFHAALKFLELANRPSVVYTCNSPMAMGTLEAFKTKNIKIPEEVGLVVFDDLPWFRFVEPPLTSVAQPSFLLGQTAAELVVSRIKKRRKIIKKVVLKVELRPRLSAGESYRTDGVFIKKGLNTF